METPQLNCRDQFVGTAGNDILSSLVERRRLREMSHAMTGESAARVTVKTGVENSGKEGREELFKDLYARLTHFLNECRESLDRGGCCTSVNGWIIAGTVPGWRPRYRTLTSQGDSLALKVPVS